MNDQPAGVWLVGVCHQREVFAEPGRNLVEVVLGGRDRRKTARTFERQLRQLRSIYRIVSLAEVVECHRARAPLPPRSLLLTFDDGYRDFEDLPENARAYVARLEELVGAPAVMVSVGPGRDAIIDMGRGLTTAHQGAASR